MGLKIYGHIESEDLQFSNFKTLCIFEAISNTGALKDIERAALAGNKECMTLLLEKQGFLEVLRKTLNFLKEDPEWRIEWDADRKITINSIDEIIKMLESSGHNVVYIRDDRCGHMPNEIEYRERALAIFNKHLLEQTLAVSNKHWL